MAQDDQGSGSARTFSIEEVGEIVRLASEGQAASATADHDRVTYEELKVIAADVGVGEPALARVIDARESEAAELVPAAPTALAAPARSVPGTVWRDAGIGAGAVTVAAGLDLALSLGGIVFVPVLLLAGATFVGRTFFRAIGSIFRGETAAAPVDADHSYRVLFGETTIDLTHLAPREEPETVYVQITFGEAKILVDPAVPYRLETSVLFGEVKRPGGKKQKALMRSTGEPAGPPRLIIKVKVIFGAAKVRLSSGG